jgi:hypothetical protein
MGDAMRYRVLAGASLAVILAACGAGRSRGGVPMTIDHTHVLAAVAATGDPEIASWVEQPDDYAILPTEIPGLAAHRVVQIVPGHTSHPMGFYLAVDKKGAGAVLSDQPDAVGRLVWSEPDLAAREDLAGHVLDLVAPLADQYAVANPAVRRTADEIVVEADVTDPDGEAMRWVLKMPRAGKATLKKGGAR